jgi:SAM-dependent methyltransferase
MGHHVTLLALLQVFKEMHRVLKPGGLAVMSFSNRCFPTKGEVLPVPVSVSVICSVKGKSNEFLESLFPNKR